jgi:hypothetical protein
MSARNEREGTERRSITAPVVIEEARTRHARQNDYLHTVDDPEPAHAVAGHLAGRITDEAVERLLLVGHLQPFPELDRAEARDSLELQLVAV